jgi:hypothetical protein
MSEGGKITSLPSQFSAQEFATLAHEVAHLCGGGIYAALHSVDHSVAAFPLTMAT